MRAGLALMLRSALEKLRHSLQVSGDIVEKSSQKTIYRSYRVLTRREVPAEIFPAALIDIAVPRQYGLLFSVTKVTYVSNVLRELRIRARNTNNRIPNCAPRTFRN